MGCEGGRREREVFFVAELLHISSVRAKPQAAVSCDFIFRGTRVRVAQGCFNRAAMG
jgi:hypothetical protein